MPLIVLLWFYHKGNIGLSILMIFRLGGERCVETEKMQKGMQDAPYEGIPARWRRPL